MSIHIQPFLEPIRGKLVFKDPEVKDLLKLKVGLAALQSLKNEQFLDFDALTNTGNCQEISFLVFQCHDAYTSNLEKDLEALEECAQNFSIEKKIDAIAREILEKPAISFLMHSHFLKRCSVNQPGFGLSRITQKEKANSYIPDCNPFSEEELDALILETKRAITEGSKNSLCKQAEEFLEAKKSFHLKKMTVLQSKFTDRIIQGLKATPQVPSSLLVLKLTKHLKIPVVILDKKTGEHRIFNSEEENLPKKFLLVIGTSEASFQETVQELALKEIFMRALANCNRYTTSVTDNEKMPIEMRLKGTEKLVDVVLKHKENPQEALKNNFDKSKFNPFLNIFKNQNIDPYKTVKILNELKVFKGERHFKIEHILLENSLEGHSAGGINE